MKPEHLYVVDLIREVGVGRLGFFDGCTCCSFSVRTVDVDVSCGKGRERAVWISSRSLDYWDQSTPNGNDESLLRPIAEEVAKQVENADGRGPIPLHFHPWGEKG